MQVVAAFNGWRWIRSGFALFRVQPVVWIALVFAYWSIMSLVARVPYVGLAISFVLVPLFAVSFMNIARTAERGQRPEFQMLVSGFRGRPKPLVVLGVVYLVVHVLLLAILLATASGGEAGESGAIAEGGLDTAGVQATLLRSNLLAVLLYLPIAAAFWYAPVLVAWHDHTPGKALFFSFFAVLANWRAFLLYAFVATICAAFLLGLALVVFSGIAKQPSLDALRLAIPIYVATLMPVLYASFYASYRDVFPPAEDPPKPLLEQGSS